MRLFSKLLGRKPDIKPESIGAEAKGAAEGSKHPSSSRPVYTRIGPGHALSTPRRYDRLAVEGYQNNVIAYRAINLVARGVASIPLRVRQQGDILDRHPFLDLMKSPNPRQKGCGFLYNLVGFHLIAGNAYALKVGPDHAAPKELWLLRPDTVTLMEGGDGVPKGYQQKVYGKTRTFKADQVLHWKTFNPLSDWYGMAPLEAAAMAVDAHYEGSRWNLALIQNGGTPSGVLYQDDAEAQLTESQFQNLKSQVEEQYTGALNAGRPLLLEGGLKWQSMGLSPKDMDWGEGKNMSSREIALAFGVPPQMLGIPDSQTYSNFVEARQSVWEDTIIPLARDLVAELNGWLLPMFGDGLELSLDLDDLPALEAKRHLKFERLTGASFLTVDEKRAALGYGRMKPEDIQETTAR